MLTRKQAERALRCIEKQFGEYISAMSKGPDLVENWQPFLYQNGQEVPTNPIPFAVVWEEGPDDWAYRTREGGVDEELTAEARTIPGMEQSIIHTPAATAWPTGVHGEPYFSYVLGLYEA
jgi:hypothetical protein